jgi:hypothetical protein
MRRRHFLAGGAAAAIVLGLAALPTNSAAQSQTTTKSERARAVCKSRCAELHPYHQWLPTTFAATELAA